jgi:hypothetical protein
MVAAKLRIQSASAGILFCMCIAISVSGAGAQDTIAFINDTAHAVIARDLGVLARQVSASGRYVGTRINRIEVRVIKEVRADSARLITNVWPPYAEEFNDSIIVNWTPATMANRLFSAAFQVGEGGWYRFQARALTSTGAGIDTVESIRCRIRTFFDDYQVVQRNRSTGSAQVTISGTCSQATAASVRARVVRAGTITPVVDWTALGAGLAGGKFTGALTVPQGGWYNLQIEALNSATTVVASENCTQKWGVGMNILCIGQSNMAGSAPKELPYVQAADLAGLYCNADNWEHLRDPYSYGRTTGEIDKQYWGDVGSHSITPALANALVARYNIPVGIIPASCGARALVGDTGTFWGFRIAAKHDDSTTMYGNSLCNARRCGGVELIAMWQGESDADDSMTQAAYRTRLQTLIGWYREDLQPNIPFFMVQIGGSRADYNIDPYVTNVRSAQAEVDNGTNTFLAAVAVDLPMAPNNNWHYTKSGYNLIAARLANAIAFSFGNATFYRGPVVASAQFASAARNEIIVTLTHRGGSDFTPATGIMGFDVLENGKYAPVKTAVRSGPNAVRLTLYNPATGPCGVCYKYGRAGSGENAVVDNSSLQLPLEPTTSMVPVSEPASITLSSPSGGEIWLAGGQHAIVWSSTGQIANVKIEYSANNGTSWTVAAVSAPNNGSFAWTVPTGAGAQYKIRVSKADDASISGGSAAPFTVAAASGTSSQITLSGNGIDENLPAGSVVGNFALASGTAATFSLVTGTGGDNNAQFAIDGASLKSALPFDFETRDYYLIRARSSTGIEEIFVIRVKNATDAPIIISTVPPPGTITCSIDSIISIATSVADQEHPASSLAGSWTLDGKAVTMPLAPDKDGQHSLVYSVTNGQTAPVTRAWTLSVNKRVLAADAPATITIPPSGLVHFQDAQQTQVAVRFTAGDFAYRPVKFTFLSRSSIPRSTYWPKEPAWLFGWDTSSHAVDSVGMTRFKLEPSVPNLMNASITISNPAVTIHHRIAVLDTNKNSTDTSAQSKRYMWWLSTTGVDTSLKCLTTDIAYLGGWTAYHTFAVLKLTAKDSSNIVTGIRPRGFPGLPAHAALTIIANQSHGPALIRISVPPSLDGSELSLRIFNTRGQAMWSFVNAHQNAGFFTLPVDLSSRARSPGAGMYVCRMQIGDRILVRRFVVKGL